MRVFINRVIVSGYLTRDPQLQQLTSGVSVCKIRIGCDGRRRDHGSGRWKRKPNYFDVAVFGAQGEAVARYMGKGRPIAVDGRLDWHEWQASDGRRMQGVSIVADAVHFMDDVAGCPPDSPQAANAPGEHPPGTAAQNAAAQNRSLHCAPTRSGDAQHKPTAAAEVDWLGLSPETDTRGAAALELDLLGVQSSQLATSTKSTERAG